MDLSVLDRKRDVLLRMYPADSWHQNHHSDLHSVVDHRRHRLRSQFAHTDCQYNSTSSANPKKCKTEFRKDERVAESEEAAEENSEVTTKTDTGISSNTCSNEKKLGYIHVRARRGQATNTHSLAERARREKIGRKMKCLQDLVPGCDTVTGKAGMLDEIINYVQSLQKQVEFLSMKLATVNPRLDCSINNMFAKEVLAYLANLQAPDSTGFPYNTMQQGTQIDQSPTYRPIPEVFLDPSLISNQLQQLSCWEADWHNLSFH